MHFSVSLTELFAYLQGLSCRRKDVLYSGEPVGTEVAPDIASAGRWVVIAFEVKDPEGVEMWVYCHVQRHRSIILHKVVIHTVLVDTWIVAGIAACRVEHCGD